MATELNQSGLVPMQFQGEALEPLARCVPKSPNISFMLEASNHVVRVME